MDYKSVNLLARFQHPFKARAYASSAQNSGAANTDFKLNLNAASYNVNGNFDITTNYRYTAPQDGLYLCCGRFGIVSTVPAVATFYINGVSTLSGSSGGASYSNSGVCAFQLFALTAGDYVELWGSCPTAATVPVEVGTTNTFLSIHWIGPK